MPRSELRKNLLIATLGLLAATQAWASTVYVTSVTHNSAQVIVNGSVLRTLRVGESSPEGTSSSGTSGSVVEGGERTLPIVLIGMSFLQHVEMRRSGAVMTLTRPSLQ